MLENDVNVAGKGDTPTWAQWVFDRRSFILFARSSGLMLSERKSPRGLLHGYADVLPLVKLRTVQ